MHTAQRFGNSAGTSLVELTIAIFVGSIMITGAYQAHRFFTASSTRERQKAELQCNIISVSNIIERDIRMAGCGLPGNGVSTYLVDEESCHLTCFTNEMHLQSSLTDVAQPADMHIVVDTAEGFLVGGYACLGGPPDTCYRRIIHIGTADPPSGPDTLHLSRTVYHGPYDIDTPVYPAITLTYTVTNNPTPSIQRMKNGAPFALGGKLDSIRIELKDDAGNPVGASVENAAVVTVMLGGHIGDGGNRVFLTDTTEVNIRNAN